MGAESKIAWTDATWNPTVGCTKVSPGCDNCYAETFVNRFAGSKGFPERFDKLVLRPHFLDLPLRWKKPRRVFVNSLSDLFHADVPDEFIAQVFAVMAATPQHTYQLLTKRHGRMRSLLRSGEFFSEVHNEAAEACGVLAIPWPLPNVWVGASVEDQARADLRIPALLSTPAAVRFLSAEPLLGVLDLRDAPVSVAYESGIDWVIVGGESGPGARPMSLDWAQRIVDDCHDVGVPVFVKQLGSVWARKHKAASRKGTDPAEWPATLRVQQWPSTEANV
jgi:protein gp37